MQANSNQATTGVKTFELILYVDRVLPNEIADWPNSLQDAVYVALEAKAQEMQLPMTIVFTQCDLDRDKPAEDPYRYYVHVIASEIVLSNEAMLQPGSVMPDVGFIKDWKH